MFGRINQLSRIGALALAAATFSVGPVISSAYAKCCRKAVQDSKAGSQSHDGNVGRCPLTKGGAPDKSDSPTTHDGLQLVAPCSAGKSTQISNGDFGSALTPRAQAEFAMLPLHSAATLLTDREGILFVCRPYDAMAPPLV